MTVRVTIIHEVGSSLSEKIAETTLDAIDEMSLSLSETTEYDRISSAVAALVEGLHPEQGITPS